MIVSFLNFYFNTYKYRAKLNFLFHFFLQNVLFSCIYRFFIVPLRDFFEVL